MRRIAIEIKSSTSLKVSKSIWNSIETIALDQTVEITQVEIEYHVVYYVMDIPLHALVNIV